MNFWWRERTHFTMNFQWPERADFTMNWKDRLYNEISSRKNYTFPAVWKVVFQWCIFGSKKGNLPLMHFCWHKREDLTHTFQGLRRWTWMVWIGSRHEMWQDWFKMPCETLNDFVWCSKTQTSSWRNPNTVSDMTRVCKIIGFYFPDIGKVGKIVDGYLRGVLHLAWLWRK